MKFLDNQKNKKLKKYEVALATRNFEIELFWKRSLFFWGFIASAFIGYATLIKAESPLAIIIACFGFVCSLAWSFVNRGSKRWQENWELIVGDIEFEITGDLFRGKRRKKEKDQFWLKARNFSVSKLTIALSDFTVLIWLSIMAYHLIEMTQLYTCITQNIIVIFSVVSSTIFSIFMLISSKSSD